MIVRRMLALLLSAALVGGLAPGAALPAHATEPNDGAAAQSAAIELTASDVNPDYLAYLNGETDVKASTLDLSYLGDTLASGVATTFANDLLPESFDLRERGVVGPVLNQSQTQNCWAFANLGAAESSVLPYYPTAQLSRAHLAWFTYNGNEEQEVEGAKSYPQQAYDTGAWDQQAIGTLAAWKGPVLSSRVPFQAAYVDESLCYAADFHLQDAYYLPTSLNGITGAAMKPSIDTVKRIIHDEGPVTVSIATHGNHWHGTEFVEGVSRQTMYASQKIDIDHAVLIVGWDDTFSRANFGGPETELPENDGAWLVKNSWGANWGESGYFWLSYEDHSAIYGATLKLESKDNYTGNYQFDTMGWRTSLAVSSGAGAEDPDAPSSGEGAAAYLANVFTAAGNETLEAASFYTTDEGTSYAIDVYLNPAEGDPTSGTKMGGTQTGSEAYPGYHTVELDADLRSSLQKGDTFSLVVKLENPFYKNVVPAEAVIGRGAAFQPVYVGKDAAGNEEVSYVSADGISWTTLGKSLMDSKGTSVYATNVCLKALTREAGGSGAVWPPEEPDTSQVNGITVRSTLHETQGEFPLDLPAYEYLDLRSTLEEGGLRTSFDVFLPAAPSSAEGFSYSVSVLPTSNQKVAMSFDGGAPEPLENGRFGREVALDDVVSRTHTITLTSNDPAGLKGSTTYELRLCLSGLTFDNTTETVGFDDARLSVQAPDGTWLSNGDRVSAWSVVDGLQPHHLSVFDRNDPDGEPRYRVPVPTREPDPTPGAITIDFTRETPNINTSSKSLKASYQADMSDSFPLFEDTPLEPGRRLYFRSGGLSGRFDSTGISYLDVPARPAAPTEVAVREATSTSITLAFQPDGQQLEYRLADGSSQHDGWQSSCLFRDLQPETDYLFQVRKAAVMPGGAGQGGLGSDGGDAKNAERTDDGRVDAAALQEGAFASEAVEMSARTAEALPSSFDLRMTGALAPLRDQGVYSTCWAFAALASLESNRIAQGNADSSIDLSEASLAMLTYQHRALGEGDPSALDRYAVSTKDEGLGARGLLTGGTWSHAVSTLARWQGAADEGACPYLPPSEPGDYEEAAAAMDAAAGTTVGSDAVRLDQAIELPSPFATGSGGTGPAGGEINEPASSYAGDASSGAGVAIDLLACEKIKEALRQYGALDFGMHEPFEGDGYWADADVEQGIWKHHWFYDADTANYTVNHSLSLVGWDDAYPKENFTIVVDGVEHTPANNGAWILRNNRGEGFGDGGYLYVPYEERAIRAPVALAAESGRDNTFDYAKNYQYDSLHAVGLQASWGDAAKAANVFTSSGDERLEGVGVWVTSPAVRVTIDVYTGLADPTDPESGTQVTAAHTELDALNAGYLTPALANAVDLKKGQAFAVVVTETQLYDQQGWALMSSTIPLEGARQVGENPDGTPRYDSVPHVDAGQSFVFEHGVWSDVAAVADDLAARTGSPVGNVAVKAFTNPAGTPVEPDGPPSPAGPDTEDSGNGGSDEARALVRTGDTAVPAAIGALALAVLAACAALAATAKREVTSSGSLLSRRASRRTCRLRPRE